MIELINKITTIFQESDMLKGLLETIYMVAFSTIIAYALGIPLGVYMVLTDKGGVCENKLSHRILSYIVNIGRSIPFIILIIALIPFTRFVVGKSWGPSATIVPLSIAATFFVARLVEQSLQEVERGVIDASICMGSPKSMLIFKVYIGESIPSLVRGISITMINLIGYSAMAGAVGGGGLGDIAIRFGYYKFRTDVMIVSLVIIILLVQIIQVLFDVIARKIDKKI